MKLVNVYIRILVLALLTAKFHSAKAQAWTMQQCIDTALVYNKSLQISKNIILITEQKQKEMKGNLVPTVTANADYRYFTDLPYQLMPLSVFGGPEGKYREAQFGVPHNINANLQLNIPLYNSQVYDAIQISDIVRELNGLKEEKSKEQLYFEISNLYYNAQILLHQLNFIDSNLANAEKLLKNIKLLHEQLLAKGTDVSKIQLQVVQLQAQKENTRSKYEQILNALKFIMGLPMDRLLHIDAEIKFHDGIEYVSSPTLDIRLANVQNMLLAGELKTLKHARIPSLSFFGTYGTNGYGYNEKPNDFLRFYPIGFAGIRFSYPLFNGTITQRKINQKKLELHNSRLQAELITEQNTMQVTNAALQREVARKSSQTMKEQVTLAQTIYKQTVLQQKQGTASLTDILLADNALREAQQLYLNAIVEYLKADLELKRLTGNISNKN